MWGGGKAAKMVGNDAVASNSSSDYSTAACSGGGGTKISTANVKVATGGRSGGVTKALSLGGGGKGGGGRGILLIRTNAEIVRGIGSAYYLDLIINTALSEILIEGRGVVGGSKELCGVAELVQSMLVLTRMYKLILCMVRDVHIILT